ncbi:hypothetical protein PanWU01x14_313820 [Parasponia andersonii]|uniref:Transmembrane protein n=1 Tax=Parasponia andersonii TaxID=3476 RepID=A0A2P5APA8_PARAD|nr:hypothetical protein PanWU01x14_313820 [Parasponia andersonii]
MGGISNVQEPIDGSVWNLEWRDLFPKFRVDHYVDFYGFYHRPLCITFYPILKVSSKKKSVVFHFELVWSCDDEFNIVLIWLGIWLLALVLNPLLKLGFKVQGPLCYPKF